MEKEIMLAVICLGFFAMVVLTVYFIMKYRSVSPEKTDLSVKRGSWNWQKPGVVVLGIGLGFATVSILTIFLPVFIDKGGAFAVVVIFAGASLIIAQALDKKKSSEE